MNRNRKQIVTTTFLCAVMVVDVCSQKLSAEEPSKPTGTTMQTALGKTIKLTLQTLPDSRGYRYAELVFNYGAAGSDVYSTSPLGVVDLQ